MVQKFRKKPVIIEAVQWAGNNFEEIKEFVGDKVSYLSFVESGKSFIRFEKILTLKLDNGDFTEIYLGNWIVKESDGSFAVYSDGFADFYELMG